MAPRSAIGLGTWNCAGAPARAWSSRRLNSLSPHRHRAAYREGREVGEGLGHRGRNARSVSETKVGPPTVAPNDLELPSRRAWPGWAVRSRSLLLHWPIRRLPLPETWARWRVVKQLGMSRHIGVSNSPWALDRRGVAACPDRWCAIRSNTILSRRTRSWRPARGTALPRSPIARSRRAGSGRRDAGAESGRATARPPRRSAYAGWYKTECCPDTANLENRTAVGNIDIFDSRCP